MKISSQILKKNITVSFDSSLLLFPLCWYYLACFCTFKKKRKQPLKVFYIRNHISSGVDAAFQRGSSNWLSSRVYPCSCLDSKIYLSYHLCWVINFSNWLGVHQCKIIWRLHLSGRTEYLKYWLTVNSAKHK